MMQTISYRISLNCGDLITNLPGVRQLYRQTGKKAILYQTIGREVEHPEGTKHPVENENGQAVTMNMRTFEMLKPLLEYQEYIAGYEVYKGQPIDFDLDKPREYNLSIIPYAPLHYYPSMIYPEMACDLSEPWIDAPVIKGYEYIILINRTERYNNPHLDFFFLKEYVKKIMFIGTLDEYLSFSREWDLKIVNPLIEDFLQLASIIKFCKGIYGNQSFVYHLANAMAVPRILEVCSAYPNTWCTTKGGHPFLFQEAMEFYFKKLYNEQ